MTATLMSSSKDIERFDTEPSLLHRCHSLHRPSYHNQSAVHKKSPFQPQNLCFRTQRWHRALQPHRQSQLPFFSALACTVHDFPHFASGSLLSIGQLCDDGCTANFPPSRSSSKQWPHRSQRLPFRSHLALVPRLHRQ
jgi:hypothetical protein